MGSLRCTHTHRHTQRRPRTKMIGLDDATRQLACKLIPLLSLREGEHAKVSSYSDAFPGVDADEVFPGIIIGNGISATSPSFLQNRKITHVLNAAEGTKAGFVDVHADYYQALGIKFLGLKLPDTPQSNIGRYFPMVANFIEEALEEGGVVLVNCLMGVSRSATCVLAFLCLGRGMSIEQAVTTVSAKRDIRPNDGFLVQLVKLHLSLNKERPLKK